MTFTSFSSSGSPVRLCDLSDHALYDLDAVDHFMAESIAAEPEFRLTDAELAEIEASEARRAAELATFADTYGFGS